MQLVLPSLAQRYGTAAGVGLAAFGLRWLLAPLLGSSMPVITFFPAVMLSSWYGGLGPGLLTTLGGAILGFYFFVEPMGSAVGKTTSLPSMLLYVGVGALCSWLTDNLRRTHGVAETAHQALRESNEKLNAIISASPLPIVALTREGLITLWNPAAERVFGWTSAEVLGRELPFIPENKREEHRAMRHRDLTGEGFTGKEVRRQKKDGSPIDISVSTAPLRDSSGAVVGIMSLYVDITLRKLEQEALRESDERLGAIVKQATAGIAQIDLEGRFVFANQRFCQLVGRTSEELLLLNVRDVTHPEDLPRNLQLIQGAIADGKPFVLEKRYLRPDGSSVWVTNSVAVLCDAHGAAQSILAVTFDLTERKRAEQELVESESRYRLAIRAANGAIWDWHIPARQLEWGGALQSLFGYNTDEPGEDADAGYSWWSERLHPADRERITSSLGSNLLAKNVEIWSGEYRFRRSDGTWADVLDQGYIARDGSGRAVRVVGSMLDITERKNTQNRLEELLVTEERARRVAELLNEVGPVLLYELDEMRLVHKVTDIATRLIGARFGEFLEASGEISEVASKGYLAVPVKSRAGQIFGALTFGHDESHIFSEEDKKLVSGIAAQAAIAIDNARLFQKAHNIQNELKKSNEQFRTANRDLQQFVYSASHDLKEPLRMVSLYAQMLGKQYVGRLDASADEYIGYAVEGAQRMERLLSDLLAYTQVRALSHAPRELVDCNRLIGRVCVDLRPVIEEAGATVRPADLPSVRVHEIHLVQLFQNLISNALKYRKANTRPDIDIWAARKEAMWLFAIRDNGIGIAKEHQTQIFGLFKRLHVRDEYPGTGIGLAICQKIVEGYGGSIWVDSEPGIGSTFFFTLPAVPELTNG